MSGEKLGAWGKREGEDDQSKTNHEVNPGGESSCGTGGEKVEKVTEGKKYPASP